MQQKNMKIAIIDQMSKFAHKHTVD